MSSVNGKDNSILNISAYKFINLPHLEVLRRELLAMLVQQNLRGTIIISPEGINLNLAGTEDGIEAFIELMQAEPLFHDLVYKRSYSDFIPFQRTLVKIKPEIITFKDPELTPEAFTTAHLPPTVLAEWLDAGKDVLLLDTRNPFEVDYGTFENAKQLDISQFSEFTKAASELLASETEARPIVLFCTGGVRCEKAGPALEKLGFREVYQLDGGILAYFEQCGGRHYQGDCFVFDERIALNPSLQVTRTTHEHQ